MAEMEKLPDFAEASDHSARQGPRQFDTPRGPVFAREVPGFLSLSMDINDTPSHVAVLLYDPSFGNGSWVQLSPENARKAGESLIHLAERAGA